MKHTLDIRGLQSVPARWLRQYFEALAPGGPAQGEPAYGVLLPHGHPVKTWEVALPAIAACAAPDVLVVLATSHYTRQALVLRDDVRTEAGLMPSRSDWCHASELWQSGRLTYGSPQAFTEEHSWRQDLVAWQWLAARAGHKPCVIAITVGDLNPTELQGLMAHLERAAFDAWSSITFVVSGDLSHVGARYQPKPGATPLSPLRSQALRAQIAHDRQMLAHLAARDLQALVPMVRASSACARAHAVALAARAPCAGRVHRIAAVPFFTGDGRVFGEEDWFFVAGSVRFPRHKRAGVLEGALLSVEDDVALVRQRHSGAHAELVGQMAEELLRPASPAVRRVLTSALREVGFRARAAQLAHERQRDREGLARLRRIEGYADLEAPRPRAPYRFPQELEREQPLRFLAPEHVEAARARQLPARLSSGTTGGRRRVSFYTDELVEQRDEVLQRIRRSPAVRELRIARPDNLLSAEERSADHWLHAAPFGWRASPGPDPAEVPPARWQKIVELVQQEGLTAVHGEPAYLAAFFLYAEQHGLSFEDLLAIEVGHGYAWPALMALASRIAPNARWRPLYHSSEFGPIAGTCPFGALHLLEEQRECALARVKGLDRRHGELLLTELGPATLRPVVRFPTGDILRLESPCRCGARGRVVTFVGRVSALLVGGVTMEQVGLALLEDGHQALFQLHIEKDAAHLRSPSARRVDALEHLLRRPVRHSPTLLPTAHPFKFQYLDIDTDALA